ncbi:hypothetical protein B0H67DRAFT_485946, partial [Lasiosphaeris hirsuta]
FSSTGYPFDGLEPVYLGNNVDADRQRISLKYGMYILANASDVLLEEYPILELLAERMDDPALRRQCWNGLVQLMTEVRKRVDTVCQNERLQIKRIAMTVPAQWTLDFEDRYIELMGNVFNFPRDDIYFVTETEALAWCAFTEVPYLNDLGLGSLHNNIIFFDFGGHNMNGCSFEIRYHGGLMTFYRLGDAFGAGGGSEQWEFNVAEQCRSRFSESESDQARNGAPAMTAKIRQKMLDKFASEKEDLGPGFNARYEYFVKAPAGNSFEVGVPAKAVDKAWEEAHRRPLKMARDQINLIASIEGVQPIVIVSGGSSRHPTLKARLEELCEEAGLPAPRFTDTIEIRYEFVLPIPGPFTVTCF